MDRDVIIYIGIFIFSMVFLYVSWFHAEWSWGWIGDLADMFPPSIGGP